MDAETNMVREECRNSCTLYLGRHKSTCKDVIQSTTLSMRGASSCPSSQLISTNVLQKSNPISIYIARKISQSRVPGIKITHVYHATDGRGWKGGWIHPTRRRVHVTQSYGAATNSNLKKLEGSVIVHRVQE